MLLTEHGVRTAVLAASDAALAPSNHSAAHQPLLRTEPSSGVSAGSGREYGLMECAIVTNIMDSGKRRSIDRR